MDYYERLNKEDLRFGKKFAKVDKEIRLRSQWKEESQAYLGKEFPEDGGEGSEGRGGGSACGPTATCSLAPSATGPSGGAACDEAAGSDEAAGRGARAAGAAVGKVDALGVA